MPTKSENFGRYSLSNDRLRGLAGAVQSLAELPDDVDVDHSGVPLHEVAEYLAAEARLVEYALPYPAEDGLGYLGSLVRLRDHQERLIAANVRRLRDAGTSWAQIGAALGVSKQAAAQRYGAPKVPAPVQAETLDI